MFLNKENKLKLYCFSPPVMIITFLIEILGAAFVWWRYRTNKAAKLIIALLAFLATFQLAEYGACEGFLGIGGALWSRIGFVAISMLPPLGIHLATTISGKTKKYDKSLTGAAYLSGAIFISYFLASSSSVVFDQCLGNYVLFSMNKSISLAYGIYYYTWLVAGSGLCFVRSLGERTDEKSALRHLGIGYLLFMLPTTIVNLVNPQTIAGIPSIMCGFAVLLALVLLFRVAPLVSQVKEFSFKSITERFTNLP